MLCVLTLGFNGLATGNEVVSIKVLVYVRHQSNPAYDIKTLISNL